MAFLLIRHKVEDFEQWKAAFDADGPRRAAGGSKGGRVFRTIDVPDEVVVLLEWSDGGSLEKFMFNESQELRHKMDDAGVGKMVDVYFLDLAATTKQ